MIEILKYIFLGLIQGITEVLPISSSAHLIITSEILNICDGNMFLEVMLHVASLISVLFFMKEKILNICRGCYNYVFKKDKTQKFAFKYTLMLILSTMVVVVFTLIFKDLIDKVSTSIYIVGILLIVNGLMLFYLSKRSGSRQEQQMTYKDALIIGAFESLGIFPGISRSGSCLCGAFSRKLTKESAADYAFMLFIPACLGALILELSELNRIIVPNNLIIPYIISFLVALVTTYYAFKLFLGIVKKKKLTIFGIYTLILGLIIFLIDIIK